ncbi:MAG: GNAT family N-acetyltransferase [Gammaproteobacteria bacterium]|nr:GNAT family N-acetyltransferase [Gammaproteobacteria bacterium]MBU2057229.1 GNAT family N-acetyltransferase [Gammaproteobacteria bacterium]MBU2174831.1 GNAT family N-acetyltransferase [Gammaproteobacteria bacterium]MBU2245436.1 GNAT family N-acetyltransferase [Gammaproteobacteria bacterium]MBU2344217.1 GNAT family N-acetyltransferase [Gammaproteobacteria bacterium]
MIPTLETKRLILRPFNAEDAPGVQLLAGEKIIADMTENIPHPYLDGMAEEWIGLHDVWCKSGTAVVFAIVIRESGELIGAVSITQISGQSGNLGYWIGLPYWGQGYCTEASMRILEFGFNHYALSRIDARHLAGNPASGRVITKSGFQYLRDDVGAEPGVKYYKLERQEWLCKNKNLS